MTKKTYADGLKDAWELFNNHGMSVIPDGKSSTMFVTVKSGNNIDELSSGITMSRKSECGILSWLADAEWELLKQGKLPEIKHD